MKKIIFILLIALSSMLVAGQSFAHEEGGVPFVTVNGELAHKNPYYLGTSSINVAEEILKTQFLPNEQLTISLDKTKLAITPEETADTQFSWIFFKGDNFSQQIGSAIQGETITYAFTEPGSYLVTLHHVYKSDSELLDTIQIDIVPYRGYSPPSVTVDINQVENTMYYLSNPKADTRSTVKKSFWDLGDGKIINGTDKSLPHTYTMNSFMSFLYHRVIDSNNLIADVGFQTQGINGKISFVPFPNSPTKPFTVTVTQVPYAILSDSVITVIVALLLIIVLIFFFLKVKIRKIT